MFDRSEAVQMSGMSEKAYIRSFNALQNGLGVKYAALCFWFTNSYVQVTGIDEWSGFFL